MAYKHSDRICAAGKRPKDPNTVAGLLTYYPLEDQVNALINDKIEPKKDYKLKQKYEYKPETTVADLINPPVKTKFEVLTDDLKETVFASYWKKRIGKSPDRAPLLPDGFDINFTFGKKLKDDEIHGLDLLYPKDVVLDTPKSQLPGVQTTRNYCMPAFNKDYTYGINYKCDNRGTLVKCCLQQDEIFEGKSGYTINCEPKSNFQDRTLHKPGRRLPANDDMFKDVHPPLPLGYSFGKPSSEKSDISTCLTGCELNSQVKHIRECLAHINLVRKNNKIKWKRDPDLFHGLFEKFKWFDINNCGVYSKWLPKEMVYEKLLAQRIILSPNLVEPILKVWGAFDGENIEYGTLLRVVNFREPIPKLPKMCDVEPNDFRTTYKEMTKSTLCKDPGSRSAGVPSIRLDLDHPITPEGLCKAYRVFLGDETDVRCCLNPSIMTQYNITHRDMLTKREPDQLRMIFERAGLKYTDEEFNEIWKKAMEYHPDGIVCIETFINAAKLFEKNNEIDDEK